MLSFVLHRRFVDPYIGDLKIQSVSGTLQAKSPRKIKGDFAHTVVSRRLLDNLGDGTDSNSIL